MRVCVSKGLIIRHRQGVTCRKAKRVLLRYRQTFRPHGGWDCRFQLYTMRGYCDTAADRYFDFRQA